MSDMLSRAMMHGYQNRVVDFIHDHRYCALWLDMGLGKTVSTATASLDLMMDFSVGRVLVVAPKRVALTTWPLELRNWDHLGDIRFSVIEGNPKQRIAAIMQRADMHIVSRDNLDWLVRMVGNQWPWDMVILDESSSFKSQTSNRWKALKKVRPLIHRIVELSATPSPQGLQDLWAQFWLLDRGQRLGATEKAFKRRWFYTDNQRGIVVPHDHAEGEIHQMVSDITVSMAAEDYLNMPKLIYNRIEVDMPKPALDKYKKFEKDAIIELKHLDMNVKVQAQNAATLTGKLLQCANGALYTDESKNFALLHDEKIEALKELVETHAGYPLLIAYNYQSDLIRLKKAFPYATVMNDDPETQRKWNRGEIPMLLTHPASSGHGLNLQKGSNIIIWFGLNWSLELYLQLIGRLYRQGQTQQSVVVHHIISRDTVDERLMKVLARKKRTQDDLLLAVKMAA